MSATAALMGLSPSGEVEVIELKTKKELVQVWRLVLVRVPPCLFVPVLKCHI